eukprot:CAMPEP_0117051716 /NCGR_PEP_ID=MMETSP0472-20121206/35727_1 /TAXON_ID=693140 ORGANISM="Tiarina fusus, Strain LIS" /NCGR_SAMPLE_ID=MMETSP0472 /ASSEMBLY_ACC=CAM_ASM_000603 /LENGTH=218 /DNA_ID=CAMNT_0004766025 /DNA_START=90 /DNA_END=746 /DNA_ORIENTATION=-
MKTPSAKLIVVTLTASVLASVHGFTSKTAISTATSSSSSSQLFAYVPDGFTPESYKKFQQAEAARKKKNLGRMGPKGFQSRSFQSFQEAMERGEATHLMPVFNAKEKLKTGKIRPEDIPYMQRGGKWDNTDVSGAKNKKKWSKSDKQYAAGGYKKEQSVSVFGIGQGLDWTGSQGRSGPESAPGQAAKFAKNYKPPKVNDLKKKNTEPKKKGGFFGMF